MFSRIAQHTVKRALFQPAFRPAAMALFSTAELVPGIGRGKTSTGIVSIVMYDLIV